MKENLPFDDFVKGRFTSYSPDVPDHIWENIMLARRSKKPKGFWINFLTWKNMFIFILAGTISGGGYLLISGNKTSVKNEDKKKLHSIFLRKLKTVQVIMKIPVTQLLQKCRLQKMNILHLPG